MERYCDLAEGEMLGDWTVIKSLGEGAFASVYKCQKGDEIRAIKVYQHGSQNIDYYVNEVRNFNRFDKKIKSITGGGSSCQESTHIPILQSHGVFAHVISKGAHVRIHPCLIMSMGGPDIHQLIKYYRREKSSSLLAMDVQMIMKDVLTGLKFIHELGMIHTDIKPDNVLMTCSLEEGIQNGFRVVIADLGSTTRAKKLFSKTVGTQEYCAPECLLSIKFTSAIDIWAAFAMYYELIVGEYLFDPHSTCDIQYGEDIDEDLALFAASRKAQRADDRRDTSRFSTNSTHSESSQPETSQPEDLDSNDSDYESDEESDNEDETDDEESDDTYETNYFHLLIMTKLLGSAPSRFNKNKKYFDLRRRLKHNPVVEKLDIADLMMTRVHLPYEVCKNVEEFLLKGICWHPDDRISAENALQLQWLDIEYATETDDEISIDAGTYEEDRCNIEGCTSSLCHDSDDDQMI